MYGDDDELILVIRSLPYELVIGRPSIELMRASLDFDKTVATFRSEQSVFWVSLVTDGSNAIKTVSDELTTDDEGTTNGDS